MGEEKLQGFHQSLLANPNIKGIPADYGKFSTVFDDPARGEAFYKSLKESKFITGLPDNYPDFVNGLAIKAGGIQAPETSEITRLKTQALTTKDSLTRAKQKLEEDYARQFTFPSMSYMQPGGQGTYNFESKEQSQAFYNLQDKKTKLELAIRYLERAANMPETKEGAGKKAFQNELHNIISAGIAEMIDDIVTARTAKQLANGEDDDINEALIDAYGRLNELQKLASGENQGFLEGLRKKLQTGVLRIGEQLTEIPQAAEAIANIPTRIFANGYLNREVRKGRMSKEAAEVLKKTDDYIPRASFGQNFPAMPGQESIGDAMAGSKLNEWFTEHAQKINDTVTKYDNTAEGYIKNKEYGKALGVVAYGIAESLPVTLVAMFIPGGAGALGLAVGAQKYDEVKDREDMAEAMKMADAFTTGMFEWLFEKFGSVEMAKYLGGYFKRVGTKGLEEAFTSQPVLNLISKGYKKFGIWFAPVHEGVSEMLTTFGQNAATKFSGEDPNINITDNALDSFLIGTGMGGSFVMTTAMARKAKDKLSPTDQGTATSSVGPLSMPLTQTATSSVGPLSIGPLSMPLTQEEQDIAQIKDIGQRLRFNGSDQIVFASDGKLEGKQPFVILKETEDPLTGKKLTVVVDIDELKQANWDVTKVAPKFFPGDQLTERKEIPAQQWIDSELNNYYTVKQQSGKMAAQQTAPVQEGETITLGDKLFNVTTVDQNGVVLNEIDEQGNISPAVLEVTPDQYEQVFGKPVPPDAEIPAEAEGVIPEAQAQTTEVQAEAEPVPQLPVNKQGEIEYDKITEPKAYAYGLQQEFGEDAGTVLDELIAEKTQALEKAKKASNAIERARKVKALNAEITRLGEVKNILNPQVPQETAVEPAQPEAVPQQEEPEQATAQDIARPEEEEGISSFDKLVDDRVELEYETTIFDETAQGKKRREKGKSNIIDFAGRKIIVVNINGRNVPFYLSTGKGGKTDVEAGKWYPFFGIAPSGEWINKLSGTEINNYYGSEYLRQIAEALDRRIGDIRNDNTIPKVNATGTHVDAINKDLNPTENGTPETIDAVRKNVEETRAFLEKVFSEETKQPIADQSIQTPSTPDETAPVEAEMQKAGEVEKEPSLKTKQDEQPAETTSKEGAGRTDQTKVETGKQASIISDKGNETAPQTERKTAFGEGNKLFTADAAERARERMRRKLGELRSGIDPEMMQDGITLAGFYIEGGARKFSDYAGKMIADFGDAIKPYLKSLYNTVRDWPGFDTKGMDSYDDVSKTDVNKLGQPEQPKDFIKDHIIVASIPKQEPKLEAYEEPPEEEKQPEFAGEMVEVTKPKKGDRVLDTKNNQPAVITRVFKPSKGSALENEPFLMDLTYDDGKKAINMPGYGERYKPQTEIPKLEFAGEALEKKPAEKPFFKEIDVTPVRKKGGNEITPRDGWRDNLIKAREYAKDLIPFERLEIMRSEGTIDWGDRNSIVRAIDEYLKEQENGPEQERPSIEVIENKAEAIEREAENVTDREQAGRIIEEIDSQLDDIDSQLTLLGEYHIPEGFTHKYPHKGIEAPFKKDLVKYSKALAKALGWEHDTDKKGKKIEYANINIAPAGGDGHIILWKPGTDLGVYISIPVEPSGLSTEGWYESPFTVRGTLYGDKPILWRVTSRKNKYTGFQNRYAEAKISIGEFKLLINNAVSTYEKSDNKHKFVNPQLENENRNTNKTTSDTPGESTSTVDGGLQAGQAGGTARITETSGLPGQTGGESRTTDTAVTGSRQAEAPGRGRSDRDITGTSEGQRTDLAEGTPEQDTGDREQPEDLNSKNHVIGPDDIVVPKGDISKIRANIAAIELLNKLEKANRNATPEEKQILSKYVGWGGLAAVLDESKARRRQFEHEWDNKYGSYYDKIRKLLSDEEYRTAVNSTINAHYTSIPIIRQLWSMAKHLGFQGGKALEPAGGIGHFIGAMPESLGKSTSFTAYELDSISGRILTKLYPQASVHVTGYEESKLTPASQDLIITNVPFGKTAPFDSKNKDLSKFSLHNYFIAKGITQLKPGGIGIFITSSSTMDAPASMKFREWVVNEGNSDLVGAIRLPNNAFKENAGTEVTTDILVFRKRTSDLPSEYAQDFRITKSIGQAKTSDGQTVDIEVNQYFADHPENILGKMMLAHEAGSGGLYTGDSQTAAPVKGMNLDEAIAERIAAMPTGVMNTEGSSAVLPSRKAESGDKDGTLVHKDGVIYEVSEGELIPTQWTDKDISIKGKKYKASQIAQEYLGIKAAVNKLLDLEQSETSTDAEISKARKELNTLYDAFVDKYKTINRNKALEFLEDDSEYNMVNGLEDIEVEMKPNKANRLYATYNIVKAPIFSQRVNFPSLEPKEAATLEDAYNISLSYRGGLDLEYMSNLLGTTVDKLTSELIKEGFAYKNPKTGLIEDKDTYLSGYVKTKYKEAVEAAKDNPEFQNNVDALLPTLPKDIPGQLIGFRLGSSWIPPDIVSAFIEETTGLNVKAQWVPGVEKWSVNTSRYLYHAKNNTSGAGGMTGLELITHALHLSRPTVTKEFWEDGKKVQRTDHEATAAAIGKMEELMDNFVSFVRNNPDYVAQCEKIYNDQYNNFIEKKFSLPTFKHYPAANKQISLYEHQRKAIARSLKGSTLLAHQVGTGKTFTMITTAMEMRRLGIAKKPMIVVQNATIEQFAKSFRLLYPSAKLLVAEKNDAKPEKRQKIFNRIAYGDWDAVIIPQSFLNFIPDDPARERAYIEERIAELQEIKKSADDGSWNNPIVSAADYAIKSLEKQLEKKKTKKVKDVAKGNLAVEKKVKSQLGRRRDDVRTFEKMGVDALFVDEAHAYKKLGFATAMSRVRGIDTQGSQRALSLWMKVRFIQEKMKGRNVILATGTPISNTMAEVWTMMNYVSPEVLKEYHIETFDKFAGTYGKVEPSLEFTAAGKFKTVDRFKSYNNAPELSLAFRANADIVLTEDVQEFKEGNTVPKLKNGQFTQVVLPQTTGLTNMMARFKKMMEDWERLTGKEKRAKRHIPLVVFGRAKQAAIDLRLLSSAYPDEPGSKTNAVVKEVKRIYDATSSYNGTQLIFSDIYQSPEIPGEQRFNLYEEIKRKLVKLGVPAKEIEIISDQADSKREEIFEKINEGEIRILMGSTEKLGTGVNVQTLLAGLHHVDAPPRPMDFEQRNGRIIRQGNTHARMNLPVEIVTYGVEKTLDATAYQRLAIKQKFINQMMKGEGLDREIADAAEEDQPTDMTFDHMMATLSGSQTAILYTFKQGELRKLQTAKQSYERNLIDTKTNLNLQKSALARAQSRLVLAEKADKILNDKFPDGRIKSLVVKYKGKSVDLFKDIKERKDAVEKLSALLDAIKKDTLATETVPDQFENQNSQRARENQLTISVNGLDGYIRYNPRALVDVNTSQYVYDVEIFPDMYRDITSGFTAGSGFLQSFEAQTKKIMESLVSDEKKAIENHETQIPIYEVALNKTFDKEEKLRKVEQEVKELEEKMKQESMVKTPPAASEETSAELDPVEYEGENTGEEEKEIGGNDISLLNETAEEYLRESLDGYENEAQRRTAVKQAISNAGQLDLGFGQNYRSSVFPKVKPRTVLEGFKESGYVDFIGQKITGPQDIADLWSIHRSPNIEKSHIIFVKDGVIVGTTATTLNRIGQSAFVKPEVILSLYKSYGADGMYYLHNHPSGNPKPSVADIMVTNRHNEMLKPYGVNIIGHVITNTKKFSFIDVNNNPLPADVKYAHEVDNYISSYVREFEYKNPVPQLFHERESLIPPGEDRASSQRMIEIGRALLSENKYKGAIIYLSSGMSISAYDVFPEGATPTDIIRIAEEGLNNNLGRNVIFIHDGSYKQLPLNNLPADTLDVINVAKQESQWFYKKDSKEVSANDVSVLWEEQHPYDFAGDFLLNEPQTPLARGAARYTEKEAERTGKEVVQGIREYIQDLNLPIRRFEEEVLKRGGKQDNTSKPYRDMSLSFGRQEKLYNDYYEEKMKPVLKAVADLKNAGIEGGEILPYVISKHALERNAVMRGEELREWVDSHKDATFDEIEAKKEEIRNKDYSGVMGFDMDAAGNPLKNYENPDDLASDIVSEFESKVDQKLIDSLWRKVKEASVETLRTWEAGNQISQKQKQEYLDKYRYFVPLRGWRHGAAKELVYTKGDGFGRSLKHAEGRKTLADNPFAYMLQVQFQAIAEQVDNEVKSSMLNLIIKNLGNNEINDLATIKKLYYVKVQLPDGSYEWEPTTTRPAPELFESGDAKTKIYREHEKLRKPIQAMEHEVYVHKPGGDMVIVFKNSQLKTAQALNKQNYMYRTIWGNIYDARDINKVMALLGHLTNTLKALYTSWNVVFPFTNFMRDFQEASITQSIKRGKGGKVIAGYKGAFPAVWRRLMGRPDLTKKIDRDLEDFYNIGGATGYTHNKTIEDIEKDVQKDINRMVQQGTITGSMKNNMHSIKTVVESWNRLFEDATRFSVYLSSLSAGNSKEDAAYDAKEASVNFNRKGKGSKAWDAYFAFFNVAVQSLQKNFKLGKDAPAKFAAVASSFVVIGLLEAMMNALTDDDDDDKSYYNINPYMRQNYLVIPIPGAEGKSNKYLSIPLPQFWRGFKSMGAIVFDIATKKMTVKEGIMDALGNFGSALLPVDIGGFYKSGEFSYAPIFPTVLKPIVEVAENKNYMGYSIKNEPFTREQKKYLADAGLGKDNVNPAAKFFTDMLFRWGGGENKYKYYYDEEQGRTRKVPGILDINPSTIEHLFKGYTGGSGGVFSDLITTTKQAIDPDAEIDYRNVPFVNRFVRKTPEHKWQIINEYYRNRDESNIRSFIEKGAIKQAEETGDWSKVEKVYSNQYLQEYKEIFRMYERELDDAAKDKSFDLVEGSKRAIDLMDQCNRDIEALKDKYGKK